MTSLRRLLKELKDLQKESFEGITVNPINEENIYVWRAVIIGPKDTPYEGGHFKLNIYFPNQYPFRPPKVKFETKIFHPNISSKGDICLDVLRATWSPALTISKVLLSILSMLSDPNPNDPLVPDIALMYKNNIELYNTTAKNWTRLYALKDT